MLETFGLENCYIFKNSTKEEIYRLVRSMTFTIKTFDKDIIIFSPNDKSNTLSILLDGTLEIQKIRMSGESIIVATKKAYDIIAAPSVFSKKHSYAGTVIATSPCKLMLIDKEEFTKVLMMDRKVMSLFLEFISNQVIFMNNRLELISHSTLNKKIISYLLAEYRRTNSKTIHIPYTKKKWADYLNAQPPSISRSLSELEKKGFIEVNKREIKITNLEGLYDDLS
ncbi:Crp/Fnr family transcriptional regulator [Anaeromicrobium sediminis]|uniref:Crp/Fnr family transcriptional regulator n=1 Tax=Anaeromicrobium sediminis TaxID=1478221 RepID=A0A267MP66_9FIRM|nr:Crp/Fnr family transcriptional regulator [Anaeromicrobium sediminis]PAB60675.1 hypothetical protein CCE28_03810 [Anaeromicrobium sediminis]